MQKELSWWPVVPAGMQDLIAEYIIEEICRIPVEVEYASEFRYRNPVIHPG